MTSSHIAETVSDSGNITSWTQRWSVWIFIIGVVAGVAQLILLARSVPLGIADEWVWPRFAMQVDPFQVGALVVALLGTYGLFRFSLRPIDSKRLRAVWLSAVMLCSLLWINAVWTVMPEIDGRVRAVYILFYPRTTGYYWQAKHEAQDLGQFLRNYEQEIQDQTDRDNYLHIGTHPPGLTTGYRLLIDACDASPLLVKIVEATQPGTVRDSLNFLATINRQKSVSLSKPDLAALWLAVLLSQLVAVGTVFPLSGLARMLSDERTARVTVILWMFVPAVLVFLPKSDAVFPCLTCLIQWFWIRSLEKQSACMGAITAIVLILSATLSLAFMTVGLILFLQLVHHLTLRKSATQPVLGGLVAGLTLLAVIYFLTGLNLPGVWLQNFRNHATFYDHNTRSYFAWLGANVIEVTCAVGAPMMALAIAGTLLLLRRFREPVPFAVLSGLAVWSILWVSGKNMGEAARLWIFLMPYATLSAAACIQQLLPPEHSEPKLSRSATQPVSARGIFGLVCVQIVVCFDAAMIIDGFGFTQL